MVVIPIWNEGLKDTLDPGEIVYEYFNYSLSDGNGGTDTDHCIKIKWRWCC